MDEKFTNDANQSSESEQNERGRSFENLGEAVKAGTTEGAARAREKAPEFKSGVADALHDVAYGLAYGSVFAGTLVNELIPKVVKDGLCKGADAGKTAGQQTYQKFHETLSPEGKDARDDETINPSFS